jgi:hypothetical protein
LCRCILPLSWLFAICSCGNCSATSYAICATSLPSVLLAWDRHNVFPFHESTKLSRLKNLILFWLFIALMGKLGPIFKVPCSNKLPFWHYCLFCTRTHILSIIWWSTGNNFVLPWPLALALSLMIKQKSIENDTNPFGVGGSSRGTSEGRESEFFFQLRCFCRYQDWRVQYRNHNHAVAEHIFIYFSPLKKDNPNLVTTEPSKTYPGHTVWYCVLIIWYSWFY